MTTVRDRKLGALLDDFAAGKKPALARAVSIV